MCFDVNKLVIKQIETHPITIIIKAEYVIENSKGSPKICEENKEITAFVIVNSKDEIISANVDE